MYQRVECTSRKCIHFWARLPIDSNPCTCSPTIFPSVADCSPWSLTTAEVATACFQSQLRSRVKSIFNRREVLRRGRTQDVWRGWGRSLCSLREFYWRRVVRWLCECLCVSERERAFLRVVNTSALLQYTCHSVTVVCVYASAHACALWPSTQVEARPLPVLCRLLMRVAFFGHVDNNNEKKIFDIFVYLGFQFRPTSIQHYFFMDFQKDDKK